MKDGLQSTARPLADMYAAHGTYAGIHQTRRTAGSFPVELIRARKVDFVGVEPPIRCFSPGVVVECLTGAPVVTVDHGAGPCALTLEDGDCYVHPTMGDTHYRMEGQAILLAISAPFGDVAAALDMDVDVQEDAVRPLYSRLFADPVYRQLGLDMWDAAADDDCHAGLMIDHGLMMMALRAVRAARGDGATGCGGETVGRSLDGLSQPLEDRRLRRVVEYVEDQIDETVTIAALADVAAMSSWHFAKTFQAALGETPHRYVMRRRIARAQEMMLVKDGLDLASIAQACGFSSHSHLTRVFKREIGVTPTAWRRRQF